MLFANNCNTTLSGSLTNVATTMSVTSATGFPSPTGSQYFYCTLADAATQTTIEIVKVTAVSGTTFTIVRGQDGTSGTAFSSGAVVSLRLVRASLNDFPKLDETNSFSQNQTFTKINTTDNASLAQATGAAGWVSVGDNSTGNGALRLFGASSQKGWQIGSNITVADSLEFAVASAAGGTTFATPTMTLNATGLNVPIGQTTANAGSFTTLSTTGTALLQGSAATAFLATSVTGTTTAAMYHKLLNSGSSAFIGLESSAGGYLLTGSTPYAVVISNANYNTPIQFGVNNTLSASISTNGIGLGSAVSASGIGVKFPATQSASSDVNTLDDYEEGTYTATLVPETSGTITLNGAVNTMSYTKVGRLVTVTGLVQVSATSLPVGTYVKLNLPFTSLNNAYAAQCGGAASRIPSGSSIPIVTPFIISWNSANLLLYYAVATTASPDQINFSFTYITA